MENQPNETEINKLILDKLKHDEFWSNKQNKKTRIIVEILMRECYHHGWNAQQQVKNNLIDVSTRLKMRNEAITVFELTKGFTTKPTDNAMKTAMEMADYVMQLTNE